MNYFRPLLLAVLSPVLVATLAAQTQPAAVVKTIEPARIAFVNSSAFLDEQAGIKQLVKASQGLELEFTGTQSELSLLNEKLRTLVGELQKLGADPVANATAIAAKQQEGQNLQQDLRAKQQAAQEAYSKRAQETQAPIAAEIGKAMREFSKARDLGMLLDAAKLGEAILDVKPELDLTADFIAYFNASHP
jgi:Skp family chaperone for outer membrane proteins